MAVRKGGWHERVRRAPSLRSRPTWRFREPGPGGLQPAEVAIATRLFAIAAQTTALAKPAGPL